MLYIFAGLPATGKTHLSRALAKKLGAVFIRIDTIEQSLRDSGYSELYDEGYHVAFQLALDNLCNGLSVVADSTNPVEVSRQAWRDVAVKAGCEYKDIEVICSDNNEHKKRVESRSTDIPNLTLPTWEEVVSREYDSWNCDRVIIDTAFKTPAQSLAELFLTLQLLD